jgi:Domain of unknown function (DUF1707)
MTRPVDNDPGAPARDRIVNLLATQFANDQITEAELEARLARVYQAATEPELHAILADLPPVPAPTDTAAVDRETGRRIDALFSGQERRLAGLVPSDLRLRARLGYVELDLTDATFAAGVTTIEARSFLGYVEICFPAGVRVESHGGALFGFFSHKGTSAPMTNDAAPVVRIVGRATFGFVESRIDS